jgi:hypothetical protein
MIKRRDNAQLFSVLPLACPLWVKSGRDGENLQCPLAATRNGTVPFFPLPAPKYHFSFFASRANAETYRCSPEGKHMARNAKLLC